MGLFSFLRRSSSAPQPPHHPDPEALRPQREPQLRQPLAQAKSQPTPSALRDPWAAELHTRAEKLQSELTRALERENTPANHAGYDVADNVMLSEVSPGRSSAKIEDDLGLLVRYRQDAFIGTQFDMSEAQREEMSTELLTQLGDSEPSEAAAAGSVEDPRWTRAVELQAEVNRAMTLENTPAAFVDDEYSYDDDVWCADIYSAPDSQRVEDELHAHVRAHPDVFAGTRFARRAEQAEQARVAQEQRAQHGPALEESETEIDEDELPF